MQKLLSSIVVTFAAVTVVLVVLNLGPIPTNQLPDSQQDALIVALGEPDPRHGLLADPSSNVVYQPPRMMPGRAPKTSTINVNWNPAACSGSVVAWSAEAQAAFAYAVDIWESLIVSSIPIEINACWKELGSGVLGSAGAWQVGMNFPGAPIADRWYPVAAVNALAGSDLNGDAPEIVANFNSQFTNWYYGTDGNTPFNQYDFVSVVLHEIGHGLGFAGTMTVNELQMGSYGLTANDNNVYPFIFDGYAENGSGNLLTETYPNSSIALGAQLTSNNLFFDSQTVRDVNNGAPVQLYAPSSWTQGSSFSHLNTTFDNSEHALMTHSIAGGEALHDPGNITLAILQDGGWTLGNIPEPTATPTHTPTATPQATSTPLPQDTPTPTPYPNPETPPETDDQTPYIDGIDNEQDKTDVGYPLDAENFRWQRFVATQFNLISAEVFIEMLTTPADLIVTISDVDETVLASVVIPAGQVQDGWNRVTFDELVDISPGSVYQLSVGMADSGREPATAFEWRGGQAEEYCVSCTSDVNSRNYEFSYAFRTISRIYLTESIHLPLIRLDE